MSFQFVNRVPHGFGMMVWVLDRCGGVQGVIDRCHQLGIDGIFLKAADGEQVWAQASRANIDAFHAAGLSVISWGYVYGYSREADAASWALDQGADGWLIDDEVEMNGKPEVATAYGRALRAAHPGASIGYNPYPYPSAQVDQPWVQYNAVCDYCMPQLYQRQDGLGTPAQALARMDGDFAHWWPIWKAEGVPCPPLLVDWQGASWGGQVTPPSDLVDAASLCVGKYPLITFWEWAGLDAGQWAAIAEAVHIFKGAGSMAITLERNAQGAITGAHETDNPALHLGSGFASAVADNHWEGGTIAVPETYLASGESVAVLRGGARVALTYSPQLGVKTYGDDVVTAINDLYDAWRKAEGAPHA